MADCTAASPHTSEALSLPEAQPLPGAQLLAASGVAAQVAFPATLPLALLAFHRNVGPIFKGTAARYGKFADLRTVLDAVTPPLLDQGLLLTQTIALQPEGSCRLRTQLLHAPSGESISSELPLPVLDEQLGRLHDLRLAALARFPLDLQLAATPLPPAVPLAALPPRSAPAPAPAPAAAPDPNGTASAATSSGPAPQLPPASLPLSAAAGASERRPALRLDDQLRGLHSTLQSLGTTTNPLHAIGGAMTYFRRYAILALLSLAAEDNDGAEYGSVEQQFSGSAATASPATSPARSRSGNHGTAAPRPSSSPSSRGRRQSAPAQAVPAEAPSAEAATAEAAPAETALSQAASPPDAARPDQPPAATAAVTSLAPPVAPGKAAPKAATPEPAPPGAPVAESALASLSGAEVQQLIAEIRSLPNDQIPPLIAAFREHFQLPADALVSDYIRTSDHASFIGRHIETLSVAAP